MLKVGSGGVYFVGIWGMGGVGKTTVARKIFDNISNQFQGSCFLANVREESKKHGIKHLQKTLLSRILNEKSLKVASFYEGADMLKGKFCLRKVLIVFDDVDDNHQLEYLVGKHDWFGDGSRIITTTRNADLLRCHDELYSVPELAKWGALELFSWHAFQKRTPDKEFLKLSKSVVDYAKGLPLALTVLGYFLYKRGITEWRSALDRLKDTGYEEIVKQLSLSVDGLSCEDKNIFLDIACFFRGKRRDFVIAILNSFGFKSEIGIDVLTKKSLLYISEGIVEMHDLIEQMGQQLARDVDQDKPWNHSRIWHENDIETVFSANQWTESVKGIMVPIGSDRHICKWSKAFRNMPCLRLLMVKGEEVRHYEQVSGTIEYLPSSLKWLDWSYYSFESLPTNFQPRNLVGLNMTFSSLVEICKEPKSNLLRTPNFSEIPNLQRIILKSCLSLKDVHPSIGNIKKLVSLNMKNCKNLKFLPSSIQMESLESLNLSGCEKLDTLPEIRGNMELLSEILLGRTAIRELPSSIGRLLGISLLDLHSCENLVRLPASVSKMRKLKVLILKGCLKLATFPESLGDLEELEELYAGNTAIWRLPDSMENLSKLKILSLKGRREMKCQSATGLIFPCAFQGLRELKSLDLSGCNLSGDKINAHKFLTSLSELNLSRNKFISLPDGISQLYRLRYLNITHCHELKKLPELPQNIKELYAEDFLARQIMLAMSIYRRLCLVSFTNYSFDQQPYTEKSDDNSVLDEILSLFLLDSMDDRMTYCIIFPERAIPTWFKHQSTEEKILLKLPEDWYDDGFEGFAICCVTCMGAGVHDPVSGLSGKYDYTFIKAKLICNNHLESLKCWRKSTSGTEAINFNQYGLFEASIQRHIARRWGVHLIYKSARQFFESRTEKGLLAQKLSIKLLMSNLNF
uniref:ADP-ribosyl cyclase/cyclic ADP-ribose hydrolase n=1 Tax=Nicotiana tabacum TaxID=4097 RepID=A0A1S3YHK0_TOBAC|nr:PREDICTED: TMV resistance protein N-like [Nicotiana tabacum]